MAELRSRNIDTAHETRKFQANGHLDVVTIGDFTLGRGTFQPGWRWSNDVKPIAGTGSCQVRRLRQADRLAVESYRRRDETRTVPSPVRETAMSPR